MNELHYLKCTSVITRIVISCSLCITLQVTAYVNCRQINADVMSLYLLSGSTQMTWIRVACPEWRISNDLSLSTRCHLS